MFLLIIISPQIPTNTSIKCDNIIQLWPMSHHVAIVAFIRALMVLIFIALGVPSVDHYVQLRADGKLRLDLRRGTLPSHTALLRRLLGEQRCPDLHRSRME